MAFSCLQAPQMFFFFTCVLPSSYLLIIYSVFLSTLLVFITPKPSLLFFVFFLSVSSTWFSLAYTPFFFRIIHTHLTVLPPQRKQKKKGTDTAHKKQREKESCKRSF
ncbi:hypothetical protein, unlikely [Trypanosoma brucei gambiense DAL972]|uniref:Uncharacterized protein n=1 Tax=Trypanosoma brucei gambiense (strain MHOM/CI/86/DAL972) TaxID=679716 RepID=C9ZXQ7_TRYB9|nr:hypothetical protein, unlikely [Trypanosoma brucei gambiense DAL972]CBH14202.1 hypothetical protein, unlikely [Trypanosoma brucei gambiense DAL972]|eukprot:XP_011776472.1 hypothetical protein, unlikely [Trypanosoma brucei gambiense DAL972]